MTRDEAKQAFDYLYEMGFCKEDLMTGIDKIYDEHEAQLKAKDDEIAELKLDFDMQKKSATEMYRKNEDIDMLKESESHFFHALIDERQQRLSLLDCLKKERKKARSIVAMLFWEWRKALRESDESGASYEFSYGDYWYIEAKEKAFRQAHKMLKDDK